MSSTLEATKLLDRSNIAEWPNPKPISTERVKVRMEHTDEKGNTTYGPIETGVVRNAKLHPEALTGRW